MVDPVQAVLRRQGQAERHPPRIHECCPLNTMHDILTSTSIFCSFHKFSQDISDEGLRLWIAVPGLVGFGIGITCDVLHAVEMSPDIHVPLYVSSSA